MEVAVFGVVQEGGEPSSNEGANDYSCDLTDFFSSQYLLYGDRYWIVGI